MSNDTGKESTTGCTQVTLCYTEFSIILYFLPSNPQSALTETLSLAALFLQAGYYICHDFEQENKVQFIIFHNFTAHARQFQLKEAIIIPRKHKMRYVLKISAQHNSVNY